MSARDFRKSEKYSICYMCVITLHMLVTVKFAASHIWLSQGVLKLGKSGGWGRGRRKGCKCELVNSGPKEVFYVCIMTLTCIMPLAIFENTKGRRFAFPALGRQVKDVPSPVHGDLSTSSFPFLLPCGAVGGDF